MFHTLPSDHFWPARNHFSFRKILVAKPEFCKMHASLVHFLSFYHYVIIFSGNILYISYFLSKAVICGILCCSGCCLVQWRPSTSYMQTRSMAQKLRRDKVDFQILPSRITVLGCRTAHIIKHPTCVSGYSWRDQEHVSLVLAPAWIRGLRAWGERSGRHFILLHQHGAFLCCSHINKDVLILPKLWSFLLQNIFIWDYKFSCWLLVDIMFEIVLSIIRTFVLSSLSWQPFFHPNIM